ncbi:hypothetical protein [Rhizobium sp. 2MFCol3.1]|uniref:hypothetical protein n=1 Tax=Rhizobium sp. 2MFCol3.1 TaxID=1246459 RepID=UPI0003690060|nr:hypothetical protein [Rhizobium sp. 2MFCol3.1]
MVTKTIAVLVMAVALATCQSTDEKADGRLQSAAVTRGQAAAQSPPIVPIPACIAHMERVQLRDEPWVIFKFRWEVAADNRDKQADDCAAWIADLNRRNATVK